MRAYDFTAQQNMLRIALEMLKENNLLEFSALGGGTALSAKYWNHRFSTDIDIFIYKNAVGSKDLLTHHNWSKRAQEQMKTLGYQGDMKFQNIYLEFTITEKCKIQFFDVKGFTEAPFTKSTLWEHAAINIEKPEEIIAKKLFYRAGKGNARDIFDIAVALQKDPLMFKKIPTIPIEKHEELLASLEVITSDEKLRKAYFADIRDIQPNAGYDELAYTAIDYLRIVLENYTASVKHNIHLDDRDHVLFAAEAQKEAKEIFKNHAWILIEQIMQEEKDHQKLYNTDTPFI